MSRKFSPENWSVTKLKPIFATKAPASKREKQEFLAAKNKKGQLYAALQIWCRPALNRCAVHAGFPTLRSGYARNRLLYEK